MQWRTSGSSPDDDASRRPRDVLGGRRLCGAGQRTVMRTLPEVEPVVCAEPL